MKSVRMVVAVLAFASLAGCGGGGGGGGDSPATSAAPTTPTASACPDGSVPAKGSGACADVIPTPSNPPSDPAVILATGYPVPFSGTLDPASITSQNVKFWLGAPDTGTPVAGNPKLSSDGRTIIFTPTQRLAYGTAYSLSGTVKDSVGRQFAFGSSTVTAAMQCNNITGDSALAQTSWSNPANYSSVLRDCIAPIGVQAVLDSAYNKMDAACIFPVIGQPLSDACKAQLANGTIVLADTTIVINGNLVTWGLANGSDGLGKLMALDTNDPRNTNPVAVATAGFSSAFKWSIGNTTGVLVCAADGNAYQVSAGSAPGVLNSVPVRKC